MAADTKLVTLVTCGEWSDYGVLAVVRWLSPDAPKVALTRYLEQHPGEAEDYFFNEYHFVAWLLENRYAEEVESDELHVGSYSTPNKDLAAKPRKCFVPHDN